MLRNGCVQEEIRFLICPELIISRLLTEPLRDNEALRMKGFERFSSYTGYSYSFAFAGPYEDQAVAQGEVVQLLALDATNFGKHDRWSQFGDASLEREVNEAAVTVTQRSRNGHVTVM